MMAPEDYYTDEPTEAEREAYERAHATADPVLELCPRCCKRVARCGCSPYPDEPLESALARAFPEDGP